MCFTRYLNINSIRNKISSIPFLIANNLDVFATAETKLDSSFPGTQFLPEQMRKPYRLDAFAKKVGLLVFLNKDISSKCVQSFPLPGDILAILFEITLKQQKLLVVSVYRLTHQSLDYFLSSMTGLLDHYLQHLEDFAILGNFNEDENTPKMELFLS